MASGEVSKSGVDNTVSRVVFRALKYALVSRKRSSTIAQSGVGLTAWCYCFESTGRFSLMGWPVSGARPASRR